MPSNWLNKILKHEATPPEGVWKGIAHELDKETQVITDLKTKLFTYETQAPAIVLKNIFAELDNENTKIIPLKNSKNNQKAIYIRMVAAASVIAIITIAILLNNKKTSTPQNQTASATSTKQLLSNDESVGSEKTTLLTSDTAEKNQQKETNAYDPLKKEILQQSPAQLPMYVKSNNSIELAPDPAAAATEKLQNMQGETPMDIGLMNTPNTYISITGPDGQTVKVSSKFSNLVGYLTASDKDTQENLDVIIKESAKWKATFSAWRYKMINNSVAPSLSNFMDIIELSEILEEKK